MATRKQTPSTVGAMKTALENKRKATPKKTPAAAAAASTKPAHDTPEYRRSLLEDALGNPVGFRPKDIKGLNMDTDLNILENFGGHRKIIYLNDGSLEAAYASSLITDKLKSIRVGESGDIGNFFTTVGGLITHDVVESGILKDCLIYAPKSHGSLEFQEASLTALLAGKDVMMFAVIPEEVETAVDDVCMGAEKVMGVFTNTQQGNPASPRYANSPFGSGHNGFGPSFQHMKIAKMGPETIHIVPGTNIAQHYMSVLFGLQSYAAGLPTTPRGTSDFIIHISQTNNMDYETALIALKTGVFSDKVFVVGNVPNLQVWVAASRHLRGTGHAVATIVN